ncbi:Chitin-binding, type 1 [Niveomyces insectorum RCEF 264]|uniref:Chitin-binding, type 1 n=1 Tax=Niveomyces insectorum RCEF 264 TaxID=1081102 RepID=A0A162MT85_9HYPO|nr:Chitin-binding, type 1 [Niveomyces insectorum RCEF 264]
MTALLAALCCYFAAVASLSPSLRRRSDRGVVPLDVFRRQDASSSSSSSSSAPAPGPSLTVSVDGTCGNGVTCANSTAGQCCSAHGYCGNTDSYCGAGCNAAFGLCTGTGGAPGAGPGSGNHNDHDDKDRGGHEHPSVYLCGRVRLDVCVDVPRRVGVGLGFGVDHYQYHDLDSHVDGRVDGHINGHSNNDINTGGYGPTNIVGLVSATTTANISIDAAICAAEAARTPAVLVVDATAVQPALVDNRSGPTNADPVGPHRHDDRHRGQRRRTDSGTPDDYSLDSASKRITHVCPIAHFARYDQCLLTWNTILSHGLVGSLLCTVNGILPITGNCRISCDNLPQGYYICVGV